MSESAPISQITDPEAFQRQVIDPSYTKPVLVDFWADWCQPCHMLAPVLDRVAGEYGDRAVVAKVNTDEQQQLAQQYGVRGLPTLKLFREGQVVDELTGVQPEAQIKALIDRHLPRPSDPLREQAREALAEGRAGDAAPLLREALSLDPDNNALKTELAEALIELGELDPAGALLNDLPMDAQTAEPAKGLLARLGFARVASKAPDVGSLEQRIDSDPNDLDARYALAAHRLEAGEPAAAMDQFLEIMKRDRGFGDDAGRKALLSVFEMLGESSELVDQYRRKMAAALY